LGGFRKVKTLPGKRLHGLEEERYRWAFRQEAKFGLSVVVSAVKLWLSGERASCFHNTGTATLLAHWWWLYFDGVLALQSVDSLAKRQ
jgi:hypothetical protein